MAAVILQLVPTFYAKLLEKTIFLFLQTPMKNTFLLTNTALLATVIRYASYPIEYITIY